MSLPLPARTGGSLFYCVDLDVWLQELPGKGMGCLFGQGRAVGNLFRKTEIKKKWPPVGRSSWVLRVEKAFGLL